MENRTFEVDSVNEAGEREAIEASMGGLGVRAFSSLYWPAEIISRGQKRVRYGGKGKVPSGRNVFLNIDSFDDIYATVDIALGYCRRNR